MVDKNNPYKMNEENPGKPKENSWMRESPSPPATPEHMMKTHRPPIGNQPLHNYPRPGSGHPVESDIPGRFHDDFDTSTKSDSVYRYGTHLPSQP